MKRLLILLTLLLPIIVVTGCGRRGEDSVEAGAEISKAEVMLAHNKERAMQKAPDLRKDAVLEERAQKWAEWMSQNNSLVHSRLSMTGTTYTTMGENIAMGYPSVDSVMKGWMDSPGHRKNILNPKYTHAGFGYSKRPNGPPFWSAQFGGN
jgi:uncharacterized protein YkwD